MYNVAPPGEYMNEHKNKVWVEKYRPTIKDEYIFHDKTLEAVVNKMIADKSIPHLLHSRSFLGLRQAKHGQIFWVF